MKNRPLLYTICVSTARFYAIPIGEKIAFIQKRNDFVWCIIIFKFFIIMQISVLAILNASCLDERERERLNFQRLTSHNCKLEIAKFHQQN